MKCPVKDLNDKVVGEIELSSDVFGLPARKDILSRVVNWQLAKKRSGNHQTKGISQVSGSTRKPFRQKGTGRARQGSIRQPQQRGGGIVFGPQTRSHAFSLTKKVRKLGLKTALSGKQASGKLIIVESLKEAKSKAKDLSDKLSKMGVLSSVLIIDGEKVDENLSRATSNLTHVDVLPQQGANVYSILRRENLILTKDAVHHLEARLK
ncbi:MAG: 50S ribosomal protein L4 [Alphaproteobacteria bacterium]|jgi:large subunit ribosomal protein L4|nr:50S ribosomal protein L4 [Alphaproteobacteria bacterium]MBT5389706.1 50S ribosomal protein L4 [Alphaproteobacteria bacterium]